MWARALAKHCPAVAHDTIVDWVQNKESRVLLLCREHLVYLRWQGAGHRGNRIRWAHHLDRISSITTVAHTVVILCSEVVSLGPMRIEVPRRRCLSSAQDAVADLLLHKVNRVLDDYFKRQLMRGQGVDGRHSPHRLDKEVGFVFARSMHSLACLSGGASSLYPHGRALIHVKVFYRWLILSGRTHSHMHHSRMHHSDMHHSSFRRRAR
jgi:hypothetical protein